MDAFGLFLALSDTPATRKVLGIDQVMGSTAKGRVARAGDDRDSWVFGGCERVAAVAVRQAAPAPRAAGVVGKARSSADA